MTTPNYIDISRIVDGQAVRPEEQADVEEITPEYAQELLDSMGRNRTLSMRHTNKYLSDMQKDRWYVTSQGIGIGWNDVLIDGQHRLEAIVRLGKPVRTVVVRNLNPKSMKAIDETRKRTFGDDLRIEGESDYSQLAALARLAAKAIIAGENSLTISTMKALDFSRYELDGWLQSISAIIDPHRCARLGARLNRHQKVSSTAGSVFLYLATRYADEDIAEEWLDGLMKGEGLYRNTPAYALKDRYEKLAALRPKPMGEEILAYTIKAFNAHIAGEPMGRVEFRIVGTKRGPSEPFPKMRSL